jgi:predicted nucleotidyltransferase
MTSPRTIPGLDAAIVADMDAALDGIVREHGVRILHAIESGSRAWGFPSPDSDYDGRFIYVRPRADYLSLWPRRDVIELPIAGDLDVNGWDLAKALRLLLKGNAVVIEWLTSPIVYRSHPDVRLALLGFAEQHVSRDLVARHYLHVGLRQQRLYLGNPDAVPLKKLFYALRPAVMLRWLRLHPATPVAPMHFPSALREADAPVALIDVVSKLLSAKAITRELGMAPLPKAISRFIDEEFEIAQANEKSSGDIVPNEAVIADANRLFQDIIG